VLNQRQIGKIQLILGIILLIGTILSSILIIINVYIGAIILGVSSVTRTWTYVSQEINTTAIGMEGQLVSNVILQGQIIKTTMYLFGICSLILVVLSIILILQGLTNLAKK